MHAGTTAETKWRAGEEYADKTAWA